MQARFLEREMLKVMRAPRSMPILVSLLLLAAGATLSPLAMASHTCATATPVGQDATVSGSISSGERWYYHLAGAPATYTLTPSAGYDVDLEVYANNCVTLECSSYWGMGQVDECEVPDGAHFKVRVLYFSGTGTYTLT